MLDATRLRVLTAVAREGSVTAAARVLNYSQPSISHHIARLEAETGVKLMERAGRGIRLTDAGQLLAQRAQEILNRLDAAEAELAANAGLRQRQARLAAFPSALATIVPGAVSRLRTARPGAEIALRQAEPEQALRMLHEGAVDIALIFRFSGGSGTADTDAEAGVDALADLRAQLILDEPVCLITGPANPATGSPAADPDQTSPVSARPDHARPDHARPDHARPDHAPPASSDPPQLASYAGKHWISGCDACHQLLLRECAAAGFTPNIVLRTTDYLAAQALVAAGFGVALLPTLALRAACFPGITARPLPGLRRQLLVVTLGEPPAKSTTWRLAAALAAEARDLPA